jgi:hypothetical protein
MPGLDVASLSNELRPTGTWAAALLLALARDEAAGRRPQRLTEPRLDTWRGCGSMATNECGVMSSRCVS